MGSPSAKEALLALADRCEKATGPKRLLDALIEWSEVFEPARVSQDVAGQISVYWNDDRFCRSGRVPLYTRSLDAAMTLATDARVILNIAEDGITTAIVNGTQGCADTAALALTAAALRAQSEAGQP